MEHMLHFLQRRSMTATGSCQARSDPADTGIKSTTRVTCHIITAHKPSHERKSSTLSKASSARHRDWNRMHSIAFIVYAGIVTITSLYPGGGGRLDGLDKVAHLLVYYIFAVLAYRALQNKQHYPYVCAGIIFYSALLELGQSYVPGRDMSGYDLVANIAGVLLGAMVMKRKYTAG